MNQLRQIFSGEELDYGKIMVPDSPELVIPVTVVDSLRFAKCGLAAILMQGWANCEAVDETLNTGKVTFWSRSKQRLWTKGEESGNFLLLRAAYTDCDGDSLLVDVDPVGPTCHKGTDSCFEVATEEI